MSDYPGQEFFHAHNANIRRAEQNWSATMTPLQAQGVAGMLFVILIALIRIGYLCERIREELERKP